MPAFFLCRLLRLFVSVCKTRPSILSLLQTLQLYMYNSTKLSQFSCLLKGYHANSFDLPVNVHVFCIQALVQLGKERRARLEDSLRLYKFFGDMEEEEMFVKETEKVLSSKDVGNDLISLTRLQQKHKVSDGGNLKILIYQGKKTPKNHKGTRMVKVGED